MNSEMSQYLGVFLDEGLEQLDQIESSCLALERFPDELEHLQVLFRAAHTLKGSSRAMGFTGLGDLTHEMENVLDDIRNHRAELSKGVIDIILECLDVLRKMMDAVATNSEEPNPTEMGVPTLVNKLADLRDSNVQATANPIPAITQPDQETRLGLKITISSDCIMKGIRALIIMNSVKENFDGFSSEPSEEDLENENFGNHFFVYLPEGEIDPHALEAVSSQSEVERVEIVGDVEKKGAAVEKPLPTAPVNIPTFSTPVESKSARGNDSTAADRPKAAVPSNQTIRVDVARLDKLLNLVGELVTDKTQADTLAKSLHERYKADPASGMLAETLSRVSRVVSELQDEVMKTRMLPIDGVFQRMPRMMRDLADKIGKKLDFQISGGETEVDRSVVDSIGDPIIHLLRNAVDHGVESPVDRISSGKSEMGGIHLTASRQQSFIHIEIRDDGAGINPAKLKEAAVRKGLLNQASANSLSDSDAINLIFAPGFSTASQVSDVSGRGVGMDIVRANIEKVGGSVKVESIVGVGSTFIIRLPLTLAIVRAVLVVDKGVTYALPVAGVSEMISLGNSNKELKRCTVGGEATIILRGKPIPVLKLTDILEGSSGTAKKRNGDLGAHAVLVHFGNRETAVAVDTLHGEQEVVIKPLGTLLGEVPGIAGASILGDGRIALIVDPAKAIQKRTTSIGAAA